MEPAEADKIWCHEPDDNSLVQMPCPTSQLVAQLTENYFQVIGIIVS